MCIQSLAMIFYFSLMEINFLDTINPILYYYYLFIDGQENWVGALLINSVLLVTFFLQHSLMASDSWKRMMYRFNMNVIIRSVYILASSLTLMVRVK